MANRKKVYSLFLLAIMGMICYSFRSQVPETKYSLNYETQIQQLNTSLQNLFTLIEHSNLDDSTQIGRIKSQLLVARKSMKAADFWLRYFEPLAYKKINGPLPVEWETEVFEKFEAPYKREGAGLSLAWQYLDEEHPEQEKLKSLIRPSVEAINTYLADSITRNLAGYHHFFLCNRLYLLNLAAIYTTGFECPDARQVIPELKAMMESVNSIYTAFNESFPETPLTQTYLETYRQAIVFIANQPNDYQQFNHFKFIKDYVNPLFSLNQDMIRQYKVRSASLVDYSLSKTATSIFKKDLYNGQNAKGIFHRITDTAALAEIEKLGHLLFFDPILSGNNQRSCASCHKPDQFLTDTIASTHLQFNRQSNLSRNTPSLLNAQFNHLVMLDGKHISLQNQAKAVVTNPDEMGGNETEVIKKILSCKEYKTGFQQLLKYTPQEKEITFDHIAAALTYYYSKFSRCYSPFDEAMNENKHLDAAAIDGFNLFMSKAQCATCHFVPQFNGVKPPNVGSEFEILGTPADTAFTKLSEDKGRYLVNPADETLHAFRTGTLRNAARTMPYMHNGVFKNLNQVIDFYDAGGGAGHGLQVANQTLASDSLKLTTVEKQQLISFIVSLNENVRIDAAPARLPHSRIKSLNNRRVGGNY